MSRCGLWIAYDEGIPITHSSWLIHDTFDGNNKTITAQFNAPLFSHVTGSIVKNLHIVYTSTLPAGEDTILLAKKAEDGSRITNIAIESADSLHPAVSLVGSLSGDADRPVNVGAISLLGDGGAFTVTPPYSGNYGIVANTAKYANISGVEGTIQWVANENPTASNIHNLNAVGSVLGAGSAGVKIRDIRLTLRQIHISNAYHIHYFAGIVGYLAPCQGDQQSCQPAQNAPSDYITDSSITLTSGQTYQLFLQQSAGEYPSAFGLIAGFEFGALNNIFVDVHESNPPPNQPIPQIFLSLGGDNATTPESACIGEFVGDKLYASQLTKVSLEAASFNIIQMDNANNLPRQVHFGYLMGCNHYFDYAVPVHNPVSDIRLNEMSVNTVDHAHVSLPDGSPAYFVGAQLGRGTSPKPPQIFEDSCIQNKQDLPVYGYDPTNVPHSITIQKTPCLSVSDP